LPRWAIRRRRALSAVDAATVLVVVLSSEATCALSGGCKFLKGYELRLVHVAALCVYVSVRLKIRVEHVDFWGLSTNVAYHDDSCS